MMMSCVPVSIVGARFAMSLDPFWEPVQYSELKAAIPVRSTRTHHSNPVPIIGMLCGNTVSGIVVAGSYLLRELE